MYVHVLFCVVSAPSCVSNAVPSPHVLDDHVLCPCFHSAALVRRESSPIEMPSRLPFSRCCYRDESPYPPFEKHYHMVALELRGADKTAVFDYLRTDAGALGEVLNRLVREDCLAADHSAAFLNRSVVMLLLLLLSSCFVAFTLLDGAGTSNECESKWYVGGQRSVSWQWTASS